MSSLKFSPIGHSTVAILLYHIWHPTQCGPYQLTTFATALRLLLLEKLPQYTIAYRSGVHRSTVWRWKRKWHKLNEHRQLTNDNRTCHHHIRNRRNSSLPTGSSLYSMPDRRLRLSSTTSKSTYSWSLRFPGVCRATPCTTYGRFWRTS